jgi:hypothetical protein
MRTRIGIATLCVVALAGCGGNPVAPDPTVAELRAAPSTTTVAGVRVELQVSLYRNFQPITPPAGAPLIVSVRLPSSAATLAVDRLWILFGDQMWSGTPQQNPGTLEWVSRDAPPWGPDVTVDVVARITAPGGASQLVRSASQRIDAVF